MSAPVSFPQPFQGDIVWCHFPENLRKPTPGPKARPGLILRWFQPSHSGAAYVVHVCYGTSHVGRIYPHDFVIARLENPEEFALAGLSHDSKFDLRQIATLPYTSEWFMVPRLQRYGATPKMGVLHASGVPRLLAAYRAADRAR